MPDKTIGVVGLGLMGQGIAACALGKSHHVIAWGRTNDERRSAREHIDGALKELEDHGDKPTPDWQSRYTDTEDLTPFGPCDFVIESIIENIDAKRAVFDELEAVVGETVPIASNTSSIPISLLQQDRRHPARFVGMHWGDPGHIMRYLEVVRGDQTDDATFDATVQLGEALGKEPSLIQQDVRGFISNRLMYAMLREAFYLLESGVADVETIDRSFRNDMGWWGTIAGPFRLLDLTGLPAYAAVMRDLLPQLSTNNAVPPSLQQLIDEGHKGVATGKGFYEYDETEQRRWEESWPRYIWDIKAIAEKYLPAPGSELSGESDTTT